MSGAQFGDPKELRPVALGEAPFGIRLYDSRPDGRPPVSEKMLNQDGELRRFSGCHPPHPAHRKQHEGGQAVHGSPTPQVCHADSWPGLRVRCILSPSCLPFPALCCGWLYFFRHFLTLPFRAFWHRGGRSDGHRFAVLPAGAGCSIIGRRHAPVPLRSGCAAGVRRTLLRGQRSCSSSRSTPSFLLLQQDD
ncbi:uncharacterized protein [Nerophis lumbriciformis]|uniref:uncharacterized protein isoform X4 n=1 Tax=Nerophis lumbriciformis TaxID=546530 RepID=UPI002ADFBF82|nr:uncharacterized protein LOC133579586 isoform X3 [Nerophis lumbriciformis]